MKKYLVTFPLLPVLFLLTPFQANAAITYATWDSANKGANVTLSGGDLIATKTNDAWQSVRSTIGKSSGKWYWEMTLANGFLDGGSPVVGIGNSSGSISNDYTIDTNGWGATNDTGSSGGAIKKRTNNANTSYAANAFGNSTIGVYYDAGAGNLGFVAADGTDLGNAYTGLTAGTYYAYAANYSDTSSWTANFGASAFTHSVPSGYNAGLYVDDGVVTGAGTINRLAKFTATTTIGNSLFSDDGSNVTLNAGNLFMQIGSLIDTVTNGTFSFGTTNATTMTFGRSGQNMIINSKLGVGTSTPTAQLHVNGDISATVIKVSPNDLGLDTLTTGLLRIASTTANAITIGRAGATTTIPALIVGKAGTSLNCSSSASPASCGDAPAGSVAMPNGQNTLVVNTSAITASSQILITEDFSLGSRLGVTCNTGTGRHFKISARTAGTNFTIRANSNPTGDPACLSYWIIN